MIPRLWIFILLFFTAGCLQTNNSSSGDGVVLGSADFIAANSILQSNCRSCHNEYGSSTEAELITFGDIIAGDAFNSPIYKAIRGSTAPTGAKDMPPSSSLTTDQVTQIFTWIQGIAP